MDQKPIIPQLCLPTSETQIQNIHCPSCVPLLTRLKSPDHLYFVNVENVVGNVLASSVEELTKDCNPGDTTTTNLVPENP